MMSEKEETMKEYAEEWSCWFCNKKISFDELYYSPSINEEKRIGNFEIGITEARSLGLVCKECIEKIGIEIWDRETNMGYEYKYALSEDK